MVHCQPCVFAMLMMIMATVHYGVICVVIEWLIASSSPQLLPAPGSNPLSVWCQSAANRVGIIVSHINILKSHFPEYRLVNKVGNTCMCNRYIHGNYKVVWHQR